MKVHDPHEEGREYDPYDIYRRDNSAVVFKIVIVALLAFFIGLAVFAIFSPRPAVAHDWYEMSCCDTRDCRPISGIRNGEPWSEIADMGDYYLWRSSASGLSHKIPKLDERVRPSRDGFYHGCEISGDTKPDTWARCIYVPVLF